MEAACVCDCQFHLNEYSYHAKWQLVSVKKKTDTSVTHSHYSICRSIVGWLLAVCWHSWLIIASIVLSKIVGWSSTDRLPSPVPYLLPGFHNCSNHLSDLKIIMFTRLGQLYENTTRVNAKDPDNWDDLNHLGLNWVFLQTNWTIV